MTIAGARTYGNYFDLRVSGVYRILVRVRRPGLAHIMKLSSNISITAKAASRVRTLIVRPRPLTSAGRASRQNQCGMTVVRTARRRFVEWP